MRLGGAQTAGKDAGATRIPRWKKNGTRRVLRGALVAGFLLVVGH